jgi:phenylalanyl-tRNA synthetase alpha chain
MKKINLKLIKNQAGQEIEKAKELKGLDEIFKKYLGRKGELARVFRSLKSMGEKERAEVGKEANRVRKFIEEKIKQKASLSVEMSKHKGKKEWFDVTLPAKKPLIGHLHPLTITRREIERIFEAMGFEVAEGPLVETEWYNFDALNIPKDHPARDAWDTFWLKPENQKPKTKNQKLLLRTHTSPVQIRYMEKHQPPLKIIASGKVFRHEATDASHEFEFWQVEGLMVDKEVSAANFKGIISEFFKQFFRKNLNIRLRPSYFPFVEPGFEVDISCVFCNGRGCSVCKKTGWMEMLGAGMVHPNVFKNSGLNPKNWQGFAFGIGMNRLAMLKYKINDARLFNSGDLRFVNQF